MAEQVRFFPPSGRVQMTNVSVRRLILQAYRLQESPAIQEQLGLKLESQKRSIDVTVIDSVERPTEG